MSVANPVEGFRRAYAKALSCKWKSGPETITSHLKTRKKRGHLAPSATEVDLIQKGLEVLKSPDAIVYEYIPSATLYFVVYKE
jgi:hypothetical protein